MCIRDSVEPLERREFVVYGAEVERHQGSGFGVVLHADRAARVDNQDRGFHRVWSYSLFSENAFGVGRRRFGRLAGRQPLQLRDFFADVPHVGRFVAFAAVGCGRQVGTCLLYTSRCV